MRVLEDMELAAVVGGVGYPGQPDHDPFAHSGVSDAEWQQWVDFFDDQARRNASRP